MTGSTETHIVCGWIRRAFDVSDPCWISETSIVHFESLKVQKNNPDILCSKSPGDYRIKTDYRARF